jgi:hypothetical protein
LWEKVERAPRKILPLLSVSIRLGRLESEQPFKTTRQEQTMTTITETAPVSNPARWTGRILSGLVIVFLLIDGAIKLVPWPVVTETMDKMGYGSSETLARSLGLITIVCTVLYSTTTCAA